jgi:hypothetical protein
MKLLDDLKERRGYCHLKEEAVDCTMWRNRFGGGFETVVRQNTEWMDDDLQNTLSKFVRSVKTGSEKGCTFIVPVNVLYL